MKLVLFLPIILVAVISTFGADTSPATMVVAPTPSIDVPGIVTNNIPTIVTNIVEVKPIIDLESFPVEKLTEQLESRLSAIQQQSSAAQETKSREQFDSVARRLQSIEESINEQRGHEFSLLEKLHRFTLSIAVAFAAVGVVGMAIIGIMLWKSNTRLAEVAAGIPRGQRMLSGGNAGLIAQESDLGNDSAEEPSHRLLGALSHLEHRIVELEHTGNPKTASKSARKKNKPKAAATEAKANGANHPAPEKAQFDLLMAKGDTQMSAGDFKTALMCYEQASNLSPDNADAQLKKGNALERLRKIEEAIECYDRAIALNSGLTLAFLHKGRAYNRISKFDEALECYERALKTQSQ